MHCAVDVCCVDVEVVAVDVVKVAADVVVVVGVDVGVEYDHVVAVAFVESVPVAVVAVVVDVEFDANPYLDSVHLDCFLNHDFASCFEMEDV